MKTILLPLLASLLSLTLGWWGGYRYAEGRAAIALQEQQAAMEQNLVDALENAAEMVKAANDDAAAAARKSAALDAAQTKERIVYVQAPAAPDCRLDDGAYRLLVDAIRRANDRASETRAD